MATPEIFVRINDLRPGDVILTRGNEKFSKGILHATKSDYSHAILVVDNFRWFEADDAGAGYSYFAVALGFLETPNSRPTSIVGMDSCLDAVVLRHPALKRHDAKSIEEALATILDPFDGAPYSAFERLSEPLKIRGGFRRLAQFFLRFYSNKQESPGMFCSEVVAYAFEKLAELWKFSDAKLFSVNRPPGLVHPGLLKTSRLVAQPGLVIRKSEMSPADSLVGDFSDCDRRDVTRLVRAEVVFEEGMAKMRRHLHEVSEVMSKDTVIRAARLEDRIRRWIEKHDASQLQIFQELLKKVEGWSIEFAEFFSNHEGSLQDMLRLSLAELDLTYQIDEARIIFLEVLCSPSDTSRLSRLALMRQRAVTRRNNGYVRLQEIAEKAAARPVRTKSSDADH